MGLTPRRLLAIALLAGPIGCASGERLSTRSAGRPEPAHSSADAAEARRFGFGHPATEQEIQAWDIDVRPDGKGLPSGSGTPAEGAVLYTELCAVCHGPTGEGSRYEAVAGLEPSGFPFGQEPHQLDQRTVGNYWPYATTLYDYINRSMPQAVPGILPPDDVCSLVAYILYLNEILPETAVLDAETLTGVVMPARDRFVPDDRRGGAEVR